MTIEREVTIAGQTYPVILSDENEALQAAKAAGRAIVGLWRENEEKQPADYSSCLYLITDPEDADGTFSDWNKREEYRKHQYRFAECGLWALERRADGVLVGKAGLTDGELGYHIYEPFRRQGYALEACRAIVKYGFETLELDKIRICTKRSNTASRILAEKMEFVQVPSSCKDSIVFCMQKGYNSLYTK